MKKGSAGHAIARYMIGASKAGQRRGMSVSRSKSGKSARGRLQAARAGRAKKC